MNLHEALNTSAVGHFLPTPAGRVVRGLAGVGLLGLGLRGRRTPGGKALLLVGLVPLTGGALDLCWISAALGGPLQGKELRAGTS